MPNTSPKTLQLPPADLQAQDQAWKDYQRHKLHPKRQGQLVLQVQGTEVRVVEN